MKTKTKPKLLSAAVLIPACITIVLFISFNEFNTLFKSNKILEQTQDVVLTSEKILNTALSNESSSRGYIIAGDKVFLELQLKSAAEIKQLTQLLKEKTKQHPEQQRIADSLSVYINSRIKFSEKTMALAGNNGFEAAKKLVETGEGRYYTGKIRFFIDSIQHYEYSGLNGRRHTMEKSASAINIILAVILMALLCLLVLSFKRTNAKNFAAKEEAEQKLFESDEKYRNIVEAVPEGIWLLDKNNNTIFANSQFTQMLGYTPGKTNNVSPFDFIVNSNRRNTAEANVKLGIKEQFESAFIGDSEKTIWITVEINPIIKNNIYQGCLAVAADISKRKRAEMLISAETRAMSKIALNEPLDKILETIVLNIESSVDGSICSILLINKDGKTVSHAAAPHLPAAYIKASNGTGIGEGEGSCGTAAYRKKAVVVTDIETDPLWKSYKQAALPYGLKACWSTPILSDENKVLGTFAVYHKTTYTPLKKDFETVQRATNHAKIAIERNNAAVALLQSEQKYRTLVEQASDAIFIAGADGKFITVNNSAARLTQFTEEELMQKKFIDFTLPEDVAKNPFHFDELKDGKAVITERPMKRRDGTITDIEVTAKQLPDGRLLIFAKDISQRKKNEKIIKDSEAKYRAFFENSMDGIIIGSPDGKIYAANPAACSIYEKTEQELCEGSRETLIDANDADFKNFLEERRKFGRARREVMQRKKDGTLFPAEISSSIFTDAEGQLRTVIILRDISQQVKNKNEIIKEKNLSDSIINSLPGVFYMYTANWKFIRWNKNFETGTGYTAAEIQNMHPLDFFPAANRLEITEAVKNVFINGEAKTEVSVKTKNGQTFPSFLTGKRIDYEGNPCLMGIGFDVSDRLKAQEEIKQSNEQLRLLTAHLQQVREDERKRIAREIHDELGQLVTAIKMDAAWIDKNLPPENLELKEKIQNTIQMLNGCNASIKSILQELRMGVLDDYGLVEALQWLGRQFTDNTGIPVTFSSNEAVLKADENVAVCLFRVYQEALTNITKHAQAKNVTATLLKQNAMVQLQVTDDGKGFDTVNSKNNLSFGILGVKERIAALKGVFNLKSKPGNGTTLMVKIPL
jgi:PAS domain S-box-containing protein